MKGTNSVEDMSEHCSPGHFLNAGQEVQIEFDRMMMMMDDERPSPKDQPEARAMSYWPISHWPRSPWAKPGPRWGPAEAEPGPSRGQARVVPAGRVSMGSSQSRAGPRDIIGTLK